MNRYLITMKCKHYHRIADHIKSTYPNWAFLFGTGTEGNTYVEWYIGVCFVCAVCTDWNSQQIAEDLDRQFSKDELSEAVYFVIREDEVTDSFGRLMNSTWRWFLTTDAKMQFSRLTAPTLVQKVNYGLLDDEIRKKLTVKNIDRILEEYPDESPIGLENARKAMIERMCDILKSAFTR